MKRITALILLACIGGVVCLQTVTADDYVDDVYFWQPAHKKSAQADKQQTQQLQQTQQQQQPVQRQDSTLRTSAKPEKVSFVQVSDTVVKAVIRR